MTFRIKKLDATGQWAYYVKAAYGDDWSFDSNQATTWPLDAVPKTLVADTDRFCYTGTIEEF